MSEKKTFKPGEICPESGVYHLHKHEHVSKQQVEIPLAKGNKFPPCRDCTHAVEWKLVRKA